MRRHKMSRRSSKKSFRRGAAKIHFKNNRGGMRGGNRI